MKKTNTGNIHKVYIQFVLLVLAMVFGLIVSQEALARGGTVDIKPYSKVEGKAIHLSDLFTGIPPYKDVRVGRAPGPGEQIEITASTLHQVALNYNLSWEPESTMDKVIIHRAVYQVPAEDIKQHLKRKITERGVEENFTIHFLSDEPSLFIPEGLAHGFEVTDFTYDPASDRFSATIVAPSSEQIRAREQVIGRIDRLVDVPVLKSSLRNGRIIEQSDIQLVPKRIATLGKEVILDPHNIIGKTPDRYLVAQKPIREDDITAPRMIQRGQKITLLHQQGALQLSAMGKSMEDGSKGDIVRVINSDSNKSLRGEVIGQGVVRVYN